MEATVRRNGRRRTGLICETYGSEWDAFGDRMLYCPNCIQKEMGNDNLKKLKNHIEERLISEFVNDLNALWYDRVYFVDIIKKWEEKL